MFELVFEIIGEFLLQLLVEALAELGLHAVAEPFHQPPKPWLAALGYFLLGAVAGGISLIFFPTHLISNSLRLINLLLTPVAAGLCMCGLGAWRARHGQTVLRIDRFAYGYLFALSLGLIRYWFTK